MDCPRLDVASVYKQQLVNMRLVKFAAMATGLPSFKHIGE